jgi:hypothetical protein
MYDLILFFYGFFIQPCRLIHSFLPPQFPIGLDSFFNFLYIYPESIDFSGLGRKGSSTSFRNICVEVRFKDGDDIPLGNYGYEHSNNLPLLFDRSHSHGLSNCFRTSVTYHETSPKFSDEIKIMLPGTITSKHHILFTFVMLFL